MQLGFPLIAGCIALAAATSSSKAETPTLAPTIRIIPVRIKEVILLQLLAPGERANPTTVTVEQARAGVRAHPRDADAWHQLGESLEVADQIEAVQAYERATRLPPRLIGRAYLCRDLAQAREVLGDLKGAEMAAQVMVRSWPLSRDGIFCTGEEVKLLMRLLVKRHGIQAAADFYKPLYEAHPDWPECQEIHDALTSG